MSKEVRKALRCLGKGFDVNCDFRLRYCKEKDDEGRLVVLSPEKTSLMVPSFGTIHGVSVDVRCDKGDKVRYKSGALDFPQMSLLMNKRSGLDGKVPSGRFGWTFGFTGGSWVQNASDTKHLAFDGYFISLFDLRIDRYPLVLSDRVARDVPTTWDPPALARFIEKYGTHVIVGLSVGGQDVVNVRQDRSSKLPASELKDHLENLGDQIFSGICTIPPLHFKNKDPYKYNKVPEAFNVFGPQPFIGDGFTRMSSKQGITVIWSKRGGDPSANSHSEWLPTVHSSPDFINFTFVPITSLLTDVLGKGFLTHAINLYLRYKPPLSDLERFLDFQSPKVWAPILNDLPLGPYSKKPLPTSTTSLRFSVMGPKLFVNTNQVIVGGRPVTGMRLYLEGRRNNRLAIHLQHLSEAPTFLSHLQPSQPLWRDSASIANDILDEHYYEPVHNKRFSHVCTAPVKYDPNWSSPTNATTFIVTGAQLHVAKHCRNRRALGLRLFYTPVPGHFIERSAWDDGPSTLSSGSQRSLSGFFSTISSRLSVAFEKEKAEEAAPVVADSGVFAGSPPVPVREQRMLRFVDTRQVTRGAKESPGHWLVTGARLTLDKGRIGLYVKFSLLCSSSSL